MERSEQGREEAGVATEGDDCPGRTDGQFAVDPPSHPQGAQPPAGGTQGRTGQPEGQEGNAGPGHQGRLDTIGIADPPQILDAPPPQGLGHRQAGQDMAAGTPTTKQDAAHDEPRLVVVPWLHDSVLWVLMTAPRVAEVPTPPSRRSRALALATASRMPAKTMHTATDVPP